MMAGGGLVAFQNTGLVDVDRMGPPDRFEAYSKRNELPIKTDEKGDEYVDTGGGGRLYKDGRMTIEITGVGGTPPETPLVQTKNAPLTPVEIDAQTEIPPVYSSPIIGPGDSGTMTVTNGGLNLHAKS